MDIFIKGGGREERVGIKGGGGKKGGRVGSPCFQGHPKVFLVLTNGRELAREIIQRLAGAMVGHSAVRLVLR